MRKITTKEARILVNKEIEKINELIRDDKADPDYYPGSDRLNYFLAYGMYRTVSALDILTNADKISLYKKIQAARDSHSEIKLLGQK